MFLLKTPFSSSHSRGSRWRRLTNFPVNPASMVTMLVKLLLVLFAWNTSPATSLEVSFLRSKYALCYKRFSFNFFTFLLFSFFLPDCRSFPIWDGNFLSGLLGLLLAYLRLLEVFRAAPLLVRENIFARCLQRVLEYGLLYKGLFGCRRRITNLLTEDFKVSFIVVKQDSHLTTSLLLLQPSTPAMNLAIFWHIPPF